MSEQNNENKNNESKKFAGKFDTIEQLEEGYKNSAKVYQENEALKKQLESFTTTPDDYLRPANVELQDNEFDEVKRLAKNAGLAQSHFDKFASEWANRNKSKKEAYEQKVKSLGEENLNVLKDYVSKHYPEKIGDVVLDKLIKDDGAREVALKHREQLLNTSTPGMNSVNHGGYKVSYNDMIKAREAYEARKSDMKLRDAYIRIAGEYAKQKKEGS